MRAAGRRDTALWAGRRTVGEPGWVEGAGAVECRGKPAAILKE